MVDHSHGHIAHDIGGIHVVVEQSVDEHATHEHQQHGVAVPDGTQLVPCHPEAKGKVSPTYHSDAVLGFVSVGEAAAGLSEDTGIAPPTRGNRRRSPRQNRLSAAWLP